MTDSMPPPRQMVISSQTLFSGTVLAGLVGAIFAAGWAWSDLRHLEKKVDNLHTEVVELRSIVLSDRSGIHFALEQAFRALGPNDWTLRGAPRVDAVNRALAAMDVERKVSSDDVSRVWLALPKAERRRIRTAAGS